MNNSIHQKTYVDLITTQNKTASLIDSFSTVLSELLKGKQLEEAHTIIDNYHQMIDGKAYDEEMLEEAVALKGVGKQANRIKCATIGWKAIEEMIEESEGK